MNRSAFTRLSAAALLLASLSLHPPAPASAQAAPPPAPLADLIVDENGDIVTEDDDCLAAANDCPLRKAIELANATPNTIIRFDGTVFNGAGSPVIDIFTDPLPPITQRGTQIIANRSQNVKIDTNLRNSVFQLDADDIVIDGLTMYGAFQSNIHILQAADRQITVKNSIIGSNGSTCGILSPNGIRISVASGQTTNAASMVTIQNNLITCNSLIGAYHGILIENGRNVLIGGDTAGQGNIITGNDVGISIDAGSQQTIIKNTTVTTNTSHGIEIINARTTQIGGNNAVQRNIISGNQGNGIMISGSQAFSNTISGNYIGIARDGITEQGNGNAIEATSNGVYIGGGAHHNTIGGGAAANLNLIAANAGNGIMISGALTNTVLFNDIGFTSARNNTALANGRAGIKLSGGARGNIIGPVGTAAPLPLPTAANFIWHNTEAGIEIDGATNNSVNGNSLRFNAFGVQLLNASGNGVYRARIVDNDGAGISEGSGASNNYWSEISTANNGAGGIDKTGSTPARPKITGASRTSPTTYRVTGTSAAGAAVEVYFAEAPGAAGEGARFATRTVASGTTWEATLTLPADPPSYTFLAVQTTGSGQTRSSSEFSAPFFARVYAPLILR